MVTTFFFRRILGIGLFFGSFYLLWWNEGHSVDRIRTLQKGRDSVVAVSSNTVEANNNGALIYLSGQANTHDILKDTFFGVEENALKLKRFVEMYQWKQDFHTEEGTNELIYTYRETWSEKLIDSSRFKQPQGHQNPSSKPYESKTFVAPKITVGVYELTKPFVEKLRAFKHYKLSEENFRAMDASLRQLFEFHGNKYYDGYYDGDPYNPHIGDIHISYDIIKPMEVSVIGKQNNNIIETYYTKNGSIKLLKGRRVRAKTMFSDAEWKNTLWTCLRRLGGLLMMIIGLTIIIQPIKLLAPIFPFIAIILPNPIDESDPITIKVSLVLSFLTMVLAWIFYRIIPLTIELLR